MEIIVILSIVSIIYTALFWAVMRQAKSAKSIKVGDFVYVDGLDSSAEIIEVINDNEFVIKTKVSGMRLTKIKGL